MFGIYGIFGGESQLEPDVRRDAFSKMSADVDCHDFDNQSIHGINFSIGITKRKRNENKDIALREIHKNFVMSFCGYGKFKGEKKLYWAEEMIDRIASRFLKDGKTILKQLEGSFLFLILNENNLVIFNDRFASKNLFYYDSDRCFIFAPDVGRITSSGLISREMNIKGAMQLLTSGFFLDDSTLVKNIFRIPYATLIEKKSDGHSNMIIQNYWNIPNIEGHIDNMDSELIEEMYNRMDRSITELVELEDRFTVPLSGGLDSRAIACFLANKYRFNTMTYDMKDEAMPAQAVCKALNAEFRYLSREELLGQYFAERVYKEVIEARHHAVLLQYFFDPFFRMYFDENRNTFAIFDGVYLDVLFSGPYVYHKFDFEDFLRTYGAAVESVKPYTNLSKEYMINTLQEIYSNSSKQFGTGDGIGKSQFFYTTGRLRRYVLESGNHRLNYCYIFNPGFNYDLADFGYNLSLQLRRGLLYQGMMFKKFPDVMKIKFKDSYGTRKQTLMEEFKKKYVNIRYKLSYGSHGLIKYYPYQLEYFFLKGNRIDDYRILFSEGSSCKEIFSDSQLLNIFNMIKRKQYFLNLFQRVLFIQQFYRRYLFQ